MKKDDLNILDKIYNAQARAEAFPTLPLVEIAGDCRVLIENHSGITEYDTDGIKIKVKWGTYYICGKNLSIAYMTKCKVVICGQIQSVSIMKGDQLENK